MSGLEENAAAGAELESEKRGIRLTDFADPEWFLDLDDGSYLLRFYTCIGINIAAFKAAFDGALLSTNIDGPINIGYIWLDQFPILSSQMRPVISKDGKLTYHMELFQRSLPEAPYIILCTPLVKIGAENGEYAAKVRLDRTAAVLRVNLGINALRYMMFEGIISYPEGCISTHGQVVRLPANHDGPLFSTNMWRHLKNVSNSLQNVNDGVARKIKYSLDFMSKALESESDFISYWVSLEVLCGGDGQIVNNIKEIYGLRTQHDAMREFHLWRIKGMRNALVHNGVMPRLTPELARFMQCLYVDIVNHIINVKHHGFAKQLLGIIELEKIFPSR